MSEGFRIVAGFPEALRREAAALYFDAFAAKLAPIMGRDGRAQAFFFDVLDPDFCLSAVSGDGTRLLGLVGFKTADGALTGGGMADLARHYGWLGCVWRGLLLTLLERELEPGIFLLDGIAVAPDARGLGIGTALLDAVEKEAVSHGCPTIRLDVIDTNPRARALYERRGYEPVSVEQLGPLRHLFGFASATRMEKAVGRAT
ncbi:MAG: GNAT family N-acetyltransferase [Phyllobacteriaceae bacterium]|nr:GNAT family N-acetyltransferase [Phyllobacteriaceae bacterium]